MDLENRKRKKEQGWKLTKLKAFKLCHLEGWTDCTHWLILGIAHSQHVNKQQVKLIEITPVFQVQHKIQLKTSHLKVIKLVTCSLPLTLSHHHAMAINQKCRQFTMSMRQSKSSFGIHSVFRNWAVHPDLCNFPRCVKHWHNAFSTVNVAKIDLLSNEWVL